MCAIFGKIDLLELGLWCKPTNLIRQLKIWEFQGMIPALKAQ